MEDTKKATKVDRVELLELQNVNLRAQLIEQERQAAVKALQAKYGEFVSIDGEGTIHRAPTPLTSVPEGA